MITKIRIYALSLGITSIYFRNDVVVFDDGNGPFISQWNLPIPQPTPEQLAAITDEQVAAYEHQVLVAKCQPYFAVAQLYRIALHRNFGVGSEVNHDISQAYALAYFGQKTAAGNITPQETADAALLMSLFPILAALTPDGTTWTFPWSEVP